MTPRLTDAQLDALREIANIGSGTAGTALSQMLARPVDISVPSALALPLADAVDAAGPADALVTGVAINLVGELGGVVLLLFTPADVTTLTGLLGLEAGTEVARSALAEIGNILGTSYINSLVAMTGLELEPSPPETVEDMLGAIVATVLAAQAEGTDLALLLDSRLRVAGSTCSMQFMLLPSADSTRDLLARLGLGA